MTEVARISVGVGADTQEFQKGMQTVDQKLKNISKSLGEFGMKMTTRVTLPIVAGFTAAVMGAAELEGAMSKFDVVFAGMTDDMYAWVDSYRSEFPLARREIIKHAAALQDLMVPMEINRDLAADMTKEWMDVAGALAAFNDVPIEDVLVAIRAGLVGSSEPLAQFGSDVRVAALEQHALAEGIWDGIGAMTAEERAMALLSKVYKDSADAVNGLEEQKGSLLWMIQELKASAKDFGDEIGVILIPAIKNVTDEVITWFSFLKDLNEEQLEATVKLGLLVAAIGPASLVLKGFTDIILLLKGFMSGPVGWIALLIAAGIAVGEYREKVFDAMGISQEWQDILRFTYSPITNLKWAIDQLSDAIERNGGLTGALIEPWKKAVEWIQKAIDKFKEAQRIMAGNFSGGGGGGTGGGGDARGGPAFDRFTSHHAGGTFRAPRLGGEGMAMLKDGERVIPAGVQTGENVSSNIVMNITQHITDKSTADYAIDKLGRVFQSRGLVGAYR